MSFNRAAFNRAPFNRVFSVNVFGGFEILVDGDVLFSPSAELTGSFTIEAELELTADAVRERFGAFLLEQLLEMDFAGVRHRHGRFELVCDLEVQINANRNHVDSIEILGPFAPGDKIVIDAGKFRAWKNGQSIGYNGDFFDLHPGKNVITYKDSATGREVQIRITHRERYLY